MKISTKNVLLMLYFKFQLEIFLSSTHDYHKLVLHNPCLNSQDTMCLLHNPCPSESLSPSFS